jgi:hypothetical protein
MGQKINQRKRLLLQFFIMLGWLIIALHVGQTIMQRNNEAQEFSANEIMWHDTTTTTKSNEFSVPEERKDSTWEDTEFME